MPHNAGMTISRFFRLVGLVSIALGAGFPWLSYAASPPALAGHQSAAFESGGLLRHYLLHLPTGYDATRPVPLVIMLHGMGGSGANAARETGWSALADSETFVVAYPDASRPDPALPPSLRTNPPAWADGSGRFHAARNGVDDVAFIRDLIARLTHEHAIDRQRVYVTGFSNGGSMAFRVGAELAGQVAAIAPVAGASWLADVRPQRALSLFYLSGTADPLNPFEGGYPKMAFGGREQGGKPKAPVMTAISAWAAALGCQTRASTDDTIDGVRTRVFGACRDDAEVRVVTVEGLGHIWAGGQNLLPEFMVGKPTDKLKATNTIWEFFGRHSMR
jgi:polyhydroxybutyrate depolymerase